MEIKRFGPASVVITDGSNLFPLCGLEHQMVNVAGVALHHLGNRIEKQYVNKKHINKVLNEHFQANYTGCGSAFCVYGYISCITKYQTSVLSRESLMPTDKRKCAPDVALP